MRICSVPKASFPVLQERPSGALSGRFSSYSRECRRKQNSRKKSPAPAQRMHEHSQGRQQRQRGEKQTTVRKAKSKRARTRRLAEYSGRIGECTMDGWPVRGARPSVRAQSRARLPAYTPLTRLLHSCTTWQWLASSACSPLQYRRDSRAEVTAHRAWPAASGDEDEQHREKDCARVFLLEWCKVMLARGDVDLPFAHG